MKNSSDDDSEDYWIIRFMNRRENKYLSRIHDSFLEDRFNFFNLRELFSDFDSAYAAIQDNARSTNFTEESIVYLMMHQRFVMTRDGLQCVLEKVTDKEFGICANISCKNVPFIPIGLSNYPYKHSTKLFCYNCQNVFEPRKDTLKMIDGCAWGNSLPQLLVISYPFVFKKRNYTPFVPRLYGFKVLEVNDDEDSND